MVSQGYHVIVVGGGIYGISAVRTYLQLKPDVSILLLDSGSTIGGVWSKSRVYPHLYANQPAPLFEFPDLSMKEVLGIEDWVDLSGKDIAEYTQIYCDKFGVTKHCRLNTQVLKIDKHANGSWRVFTSDTRDANKQEELRCSKLIMAMGHASNPRTPQNIDTSNYQGQVFHMKEFASRHSVLLKDPAIKNITVVGGSKSAWEAAGLFALEGKHVNWLIREGVGPALMPRARPDGKKHMAEGKNVRALAAIAPNVFNPDNWLTRFLYGGTNWFGRWFTANFWKLPLKADLKKLELGNRRMLKPLTDSMLWISAGMSMSHPHDELIYDLVDEGNLLKISRASITSAKDKVLTLSNGTTIESDALVLATGWVHPLYTTTPLFPPDLALKLELPVPLSTEPVSHASHWASLESAAVDKVHSLYPYSREPPKHLNLVTRPASELSHIHHFRCLVPPGPAAENDRNIVFLGNVHTGASHVHAVACSLWSFAYLEGVFPKGKDARLSQILTDKDYMEKQIAWEQSYFRVRYLNIFEGVTVGAFETREMIDKLLEDLGIRSDRHAMLVDKNSWFGGWRAWFSEYFGNYASNEYAGVVDEFKAMIDQQQLESQ